MLARIAVAFCLTAALSTAASAQIKIGLMVSATGPTSAIGIPQKNAGDILPKKISDATVDTSRSRTAATRRAPCRTSRSSCRRTTSTR